MKIGATATPVGKDPEDLFGIFKFVSPALFPSLSKFGAKYIKYAGYGNIAGIMNKEHLIKQYSPHMIVKTKEEISSQLPDLVVMQRHCTMTPDQQEMNERIMNELSSLKDKEKALKALCRSKADVENNEELKKIDAMILAMQTFAQELCDNPILLQNSDSEMSKQYVTDDLSSPKLNMLLELVEEIVNSGEKVCIFSKYSNNQKIIADAIHKEIDKKMGIAFVDGTMSSKTRSNEVYAKFRDNDNYKVLLMSDAGAEGFNLSKCKYLIEFDLADSYLIQTQRHGRIERNDSIHDTVFVYQLIAYDSWDEIAQKIIEKKENYDSELIKVLAKN
jgi:ERCC4-related helicase